MKKIFNISVLFLLSIICTAQIQVFETGNVAIGDTTLTTKKLSVKATGSCDYGICSSIHSSTSTATAIYGVVNTTSTKQIAIHGNAYGGTSSSGHAYGVYGVAGNHSSGYNCGVLGEIKGSRYGAGVFGTISPVLPQLRSKYAGYFYGNAHVTGTLTTEQLTTLSDARYKSNIQAINSSALAKILALNPVQYTMLSGNTIALMNSEPNDTISTMIASEEELTKANKIHYGLLAQEVKKLYPELVHEDGAGVMSINYIELIPLLIQAVQDLSAQVSALSSSSSATRQQVAAQHDNSIETSVAMLYQNTPNPFTEATVISYIVPVEALQASIYIYNMLGEQLSQYDVSTFGEGSITISANELYVGTFLYSLVVDGKLIDTKQMILTQ